ncbi:MAG: GNAT family N-acetyltransferase [Patescibacteria group bacterium]
MDTISYDSFRPTRDTALMQKLILCYQNVFSASPWFEWKRCTTCNRKWGREQETEIQCMRCPKCGSALTDFWPSDVVEQDICKELTLPGASCWLACHREKIVGFCWGYPIALIALEEKLGIACATPIQHTYGNITQVAYQDEIGVEQKYRGHGLGSMLFNLRKNDFLKQGLHIGVVRTKTQPPTVTYHWYQKLGYQTVARYNDKDGKVILAIDLQKLPG